MHCVVGISEYKLDLFTPKSPKGDFHTVLDYLLLSIQTFENLFYSFVGLTDEIKATGKSPLGDLGVGLILHATAQYIKPNYFFLNENQTN